jgi:integrase
MGSVNWRKRGARYQVSWRLDDGSQGSITVATREEAVTLTAEKRLEITTGAWKGRRRGRLSFHRWADDWWAVWSTDPTLSPNSLVMTESRLRNHLRPFFGPRAIEDITPRLLRQWQNQMAAQLGYATVMACRSVLFRILQFAEDENAIPANPMRKVAAPKRPIDPDVVLGSAKRRVLTPEEAGRLLAAFPSFWWDHVITLLGCGLRISELAGLRRTRVDLDRGVLQVVDTRYQAGSKYGSGFKGPKSAAGIREIPLARQVSEAIARRLPPPNDPIGLVFTGPGGGPGRPGAPGVPRGTRTVLSRDNFRRLYMRAAARADLPSDVQLRGPHDLRHSFATWLEDAGIPTRVIAEPMGHAGGRFTEQGSAIGRIYRHTTSETHIRVTAAIGGNLAIVLRVAEQQNSSWPGQQGRIRLAIQRQVWETQDHDEREHHAK